MTPRLVGVVERAQRSAFAWGAHDCCTFPADVVWAATGEDPIAFARGYRTERQAVEILRARFETLELQEVLAQLADHHNARPITLGQARDGDVFAAEIDGRVPFRRMRSRTRLGVRFNQRFLSPGPIGLETVAPDDVRAIWRFS